MTLVTLVTMADSWGLVLVLILVLVFAAVLWLLRTVIEYPGLLHLRCVVTEDSASGETQEMVTDFKMDKLRISVRRSGHGDAQRQEDCHSSQLPFSVLTIIKACQ